MKLRYKYLICKNKTKQCCATWVSVCSSAPLLCVYPKMACKAQAQSTVDFPTQICWVTLPLQQGGNYMLSLQMLPVLSSACVEQAKMWSVLDALLLHGEYVLFLRRLEAQWV